MRRWYQSPASETSRCAHWSRTHGTRGGEVVSLAFEDETSELPVENSLLNEYPERQELWRALRILSGYFLKNDTVVQTVRDQKDKNSARAVRSKVNRILADIHEGRYRPLIFSR